MGTVFVHMDPVDVLAVEVAADMIPLFYDEATLSFRCRLLGKHRAKGAAAHDEIVVFFQVRISFKHRFIRHCMVFSSLYFGTNTDIIAVPSLFCNAFLQGFTIRTYCLSITPKISDILPLFPRVDHCAPPGFVLY